MSSPKKKRRSQIGSFFFFSGERGIRTPGASQLNGFQDRRNRPLCHLSSSECACRMNDACQRPWATAIPPLKSKVTFELVLLVFRNQKILNSQKRVQKYCFFLNCANIFEVFLRMWKFYSNFAAKNLYLRTKCYYKY